MKYPIGQRLYDNLTHLVNTNEAFYTVDHVLNGVRYRVFTYRLASYEDFLLPDALECRGHMFRINDDDSMDALVSLPFEKFFNLNENPFTTDLDLSQYTFIHDKRDGSLISTYEHEGMVCLKSKTSLTSDQALDATRKLRSDPVLEGLTYRMILNQWTVSFEYTSPENRIVLPYQTDELRVLGARHNLTGFYASPQQLYHYFGDKYMTEDKSELGLVGLEEFLSTVPDMKGIEGFVIGLMSGQRFKIKTSEYLSLHRAKDSINSDKRLFEVCLNEASDDLRSLFVDDQYTLDKISDMERTVRQAYNSMVQCVENFWSANNHLDRKSYAIKGQTELSKTNFGLAMSKYTGRDPEYKKMLMRNFEQYLEDGNDSG